MPNVQVWMLQGILDGDTGGWVEGEHAVEEIQGVGVGVREEAVEWDLWHEWEVTDVFLSSGGANSSKGFLVRCAQVVQDLV